MYGNRRWDRYFIFTLLIAGIWSGLEMLLNDSKLIKKLHEKHQNRKRFINKCVHILCGFAAYIGAMLIVGAAQIFLGIDLFAF